MELCPKAVLQTVDQAIRDHPLSQTSWPKTALCEGWVWSLNLGKHMPAVPHSVSAQGFSLMDVSEDVRFLGQRQRTLLLTAQQAV